LDVVEEAGLDGSVGEVRESDGLHGRGCAEGGQCLGRIEVVAAESHGSE
jgi:hypothetical protein